MMPLIYHFVWNRITWQTIVNIYLRFIENNFVFLLFAQIYFILDDVNYWGADAGKTWTQFESINMKYIYDCTLCPRTGAGSYVRCNRLVIFQGMQNHKTKCFTNPIANVKSGFTNVVQIEERALTEWHAAAWVLCKYSNCTQPHAILSVRVLRSVQHLWTYWFVILHSMIFSQGFIATKRIIFEPDLLLFCYYILNISFHNCDKCESFDGGVIEFV